MYGKIILTHIIPEGSKLVNQTERISENYNTQNQTALVTESDFNLVFQQNYSVILNYAQYLLGDLDVALDVTQEAFIRFYNNKPAHDNVVGWLKKVAANLSYNYMREKKVRYNKDSEIYLQMQETIIVVEEKVIDNIEILKVRALSQEQGITILISSHILSEVQLMADYVGIIDRGVLIKEADIKLLNSTQQDHLVLEVSNIEIAIKILDDINVRHKMENDVLKVYCDRTQNAMINRRLIITSFIAVFYVLVAAINITCASLLGFNFTFEEARSYSLSLIYAGMSTVLLVPMMMFLALLFKSFIPALVIAVAGTISNILVLNWEYSYFSPWAVPADIFVIL